MLKEEEGPVETATGFTDRFIDAGIAKLDASFGDGYAKANPQLLVAYLETCASNLNAFMTAAVAAQDDFDLDDALELFEEDSNPAPAPKDTRRRR